MSNSDEVAGNDLALGLYVLRLIQPQCQTQSSPSHWTPNMQVTIHYIFSITTYLPPYDYYYYYYYYYCYYCYYDCHHH